MKGLKISKLPKMNVPLFESGTVIFCRDFSEWRFIHSQIGIDQEEDGSNGKSHTYSNGSEVMHIIGLFNGKNSTLAHECSHMAFDICSRVGVEVEAGKANETFCYLVSKIFEFCDKNNKPA
ncbi:hypothetical protein [Rosenbergiella epipactidis]|uniref:hypothetical protein n=1 Tax=Rosenbergiella epipactidis TaxID=1544694 RepID=UPI001F4DDE85|nr:hypothetical protein [Rosenbergiella epipactidis]